MQRLFSKLAVAAAVVFVTVSLVTPALALEPTVVTFDNGLEGWSAGPDCQPIIPDGGNPGAHCNVANRDCDTGENFLNGWFFLSTFSNPAFVGDYSAKGPVRISIDVDVVDFTYYWFGSPVEEYRHLVFEFVDYDNPYTDPDTGYFWPWTSVIYVADFLPNRDAGWKTFTLDIMDPTATELPEGWTGFGGPEDPTTWMPQLPPDRTFADVLAGVDELQIHTIEPGYWYEYAFVYEINFDNIAITEMPRECNGTPATIWVDNDGIVHGGEFDGLPYAGELTGTMHGDDVIVGTNGDDEIQGLGGDDLICGLDGNDALHGHFGNDFILGGRGDDTLTGQRGHDYLDGGEGRDVLNGGQDSDTCINGEVVTQCGEDLGHGSRPTRMPRDTSLRLDPARDAVEFDRN